MTNAPIFIMGIMPRSGTVWLRQLLLQHPRCAGASPWEDWLVPNAYWLEHYVRAVYRFWQPRDEVREEWLYEALGRGLLTIWDGRVGEKRLVTKTPSVRNLHLFFKFFPQAYLLVLVRDGRAVVESAARTSGLDHETGARAWARAAREILKFRQEADDAAGRMLLVRYEDLYMDLETELRRILDFVRLPVDEYDFEAAHNLPVRGSSAVSRMPSGRVHWTPVEKTAAFQPLMRWHSWSRLRHERFNWIAAPYLEAFGYEPRRFAGSRIGWILLNLIFDLRWWLTLAPRVALRRLPEYLHLLIPQWVLRASRMRSTSGRVRSGAG
ncbi:MAG: sulfotransferase [Armatimonadota bacterium]|nr:sulfotransferase [Armatimonadota bacterium]MDR7494701.1 sulfotransferase [Armatimonadota bacterium]